MHTEPPDSDSPDCQNSIKRKQKASKICFARQENQKKIMESPKIGIPSKQLIHNCLIVELLLVKVSAWRIRCQTLERRLLVRDSRAESLLSLNYKARWWTYGWDFFRCLGEKFYFPWRRLNGAQVGSIRVFHPLCTKGYESIKYF